MGRLVETAHAKINLALDVGAVRPDGYHEIHSVMQSLLLGDVVVLEDRPAGVSLECLAAAPVHQGAMRFIGSDEESMPPFDQRNLAWRAAEQLMEDTGICRGLHITIHKGIPLSAGLGGGSADAAAVLRGLNRLWGLGLSLEELAAIGAKLGADIPFCLYGGTAEAKGIGEIIRSVQPLPPWPVILLKPPISISTAACYREYDGLSRAVRIDVTSMLSAVVEQNLDRLVACLGNSLEAVVLPRFAEMAYYRTLMEKRGCLGVLMSGSGPTLFGLVRDLEHGCDIFARLAQDLRQEQQGPLPNLYLTRLC